MKLDSLEPLPWEELSGLPVHVLIRDYPELIPILRSRGLSLVESGGLTLDEALGPDREGLEEEISQALGWRLR